MANKFLANECIAMKAVIILLVVILAFFQYKLWIEPNSVIAMVQIHKRITAQQQKDNALKKKNDALIAEVKDLKHGNATVEALARNELGMIKKGEVFYEFVPATSQTANSQTAKS